MSQGSLSNLIALRMAKTRWSFGSVATSDVLDYSMFEFSCVTPVSK